jgi:ParB family chromosome partitioning protein
MLVEGTLSAGHGRAVLMVEGEKAQVAFAEELVRQGLSVRQAEAAAKTFNESVAGVAAEAAAEHAQAVKAAEAAKVDAEVRAAAVRARQEAEEPLEVFDFDEEDLVGSISNADGAVEIDLEVEE